MRARINIEKLTNHSKIGMILRYENGDLLGHQIRWLHDNIYDNPDEVIHLVSSHDLGQIEDYRQTGLIGEKFEWALSISAELVHDLSASYPSSDFLFVV